MNKSVIALCAVACLSLVFLPAAFAETKVTITAMDKQDASAGGFNAWLDGYQKEFEEKYPWITVEHLPLYNVAVEQRTEYWSTQFQSGKITLGRFDNIQQAMTLAKLGMLAPVDTKQISDMKSFIPSLISDSTIAGKVYAIPTFFEPLGLVVRRDYLKDAGFPVDYMPKTWDEFATMCKKIQEAKPGRIAISFLATGDAGQNPVELMLWANGAKRASQDAKGKVKLNFTAPEVVQAVQFGKDLIYKHKVTQANPSAAWGDCFGAWQNGTAAIHQWYPSWVNWAFNGQSIKAEDFNYVIMPKGPSGKAPYTRMTATCYSIAKGASADQVKAASLYIDWLTKIDYYKKAYEFCDDNGLNFVSPAPMSNVDWSKTNTNVPAQWFKTLGEMQKIAIADYAPNNLSEKYFWTTIGKILGDEKSDVKAELAAGQKLAETEWLNKFNAEIK